MYPAFACSSAKKPCAATEPSLSGRFAMHNNRGSPRIEGEQQKRTASYKNLLYK